MHTYINKSVVDFHLKLYTRYKTTTYIPLSHKPQKSRPAPAPSLGSCSIAPTGAVRAPVPAVVVALEEHLWLFDNLCGALGIGIEGSLL